MNLHRRLYYLSMLIAAVFALGTGDTGAFVIEELLGSGHPLIIVDASEDRIQHIVEQHPDTFIPFVVGKAMRDTNLRQEADLLVLAIRDASGEHFLYNPPPEQVLEEGSTLIVLGPVESVHNIRNRMA